MTGKILKFAHKILNMIELVFYIFHEVKITISLHVNSGPELGREKKRFTEITILRHSINTSFKYILRL